MDHVIPEKDGGSRFDEGNLQSLCRFHHSEKTRRENSVRKKSSEELAWLHYEVSGAGSDSLGTAGKTSSC